MQDRKADRSMKTSCDARPDHTSGSWAALWDFVTATTGCTPDSRRLAVPHKSAESATARNRCAIVRPGAPDWTLLATTAAYGDRGRARLEDAREGPDSAPEPQGPELS